jgi:hypothetical protein
MHDARGRLNELFCYLVICSEINFICIRQKYIQIKRSEFKNIVALSSRSKTERRAKGIKMPPPIAHSAHISAALIKSANVREQAAWVAAQRQKVVALARNRTLWMKLLTVALSIAATLFVSALFGLCFGTFARI